MSNKITHATRLTVLKHLAAGKPADLVAKIMKLSHYEIIDIGAEHGYPDVAKMAEGVASITREIENGERNELASRPLAGPETITPRPAPTPHRPAASTSPAPRPAAATAAAPSSAPPSPHVLTQPDELRAVINTGKQSSSKRVQALTNRIIDDLARLKDAIRAEQAKTEAARRKAAAKAAAARARAAEREALQTKRADLEAELAEVKAKLRGGKKTAAAPKTSPVTPAGTGVVEPPAKEIRAWAREAGLEVPDTGKLPQKVRDAYAAAHISEQAA